MLREEGGKEGRTGEGERGEVCVLLFLLRFNIRAQAPDCVDPVSK